MAWNWYGVKTLYRTTVVGTPNLVDRYYEEGATLVEERVVLFRARSFNEAAAKAEQEAREYARGKRVNRYGQTIKQRFLGASDAFEMFDRPGKGAEVFSATELVASTISDAQIRLSRMGREKRGDRWRRTKFLQREFAPASGRPAL